MNSKSKFFILFVVLFFLVYFLLPSPAVPDALPDSFRSTEPGDTIEIPGLYSYYTNMPREEVIAFYEKFYTRSSFLNLPFLTYRLNHPPEYVWTAIRPTVHSSYLEEIVIPFRESYIINGFEPQNDPFKKEEERPGSGFEINGKEYKAKVIVLPIKSHPVVRIAIFAGIVLIISFLVGQLNYGPFRHRRLL